LPSSPPTLTPRAEEPDRRALPDTLALDTMGDRPANEVQFGFWAPDLVAGNLSNEDRVRLLTAPAPKPGRDKLSDLLAAYTHRLVGSPTDLLDSTTWAASVAVEHSRSGRPIPVVARNLDVAARLTLLLADDQLVVQTLPLATLPQVAATAEELGARVIDVASPPRGPSLRGPGPAWHAVVASTQPDGGAVVVVATDLRDPVVTLSTSPIPPGFSMTTGTMRDYLVNSLTSVPRDRRRRHQVKIARQRLEFDASRRGTAQQHAVYAAVAAGWAGIPLLSLPLASWRWWVRRPDGSEHFRAGFSGGLERAWSLIQCAVITTLFDDAYGRGFHSPDSLWEQRQMVDGSWGLFIPRPLPSPRKLADDDDDTPTGADPDDAEPPARQFLVPYAPTGKLATTESEATVVERMAVERQAIAKTMIDTAMQRAGLSDQETYALNAYCDLGCHHPRRHGLLVEVAERMGVAPSTAKTYIYRAFAKLRPHLGDELTSGSLDGSQSAVNQARRAPWLPFGPLDSP
jgi:hypothetical protein